MLTDPTEHDDVSAANPDVVAALYKRIQVHEATVFSPFRGANDPQACAAAIHKWGGFWGPFLP